MPEIATVILAAGEGTRMHSTLPKVLHPVCGRPMIDYSLDLARSLHSKKVVVVTPPQKKNGVEEHLKNGSHIEAVPQSKPKGTGHAVMVCETALKNFQGTILILYGDCPLIQSTTLRAFLDHLQEADATFGFISAKLPDPSGFGRVVRDGSGEVLRVVEEKEASPGEKAIHEANVGIYGVQREWLFSTLKKLKPHPVTREYYLTDVIEWAVKDHIRMVGFRGEEPEQFLGINSRRHLSLAEEILRRRLVEHWMERGVSFIDPRQVYLEADVHIGADTVVHPQVQLKGKTWIGNHCLIEAGAVLKNMIVGDAVHIHPYCVLEESAIAKEAQIGPFARLRPLSQVGPKAKVGNFVELKKTKLGAGAKANHLTYLGDAEIGDESNIGCGTITCNYDGQKKHPTKLGKRVFVGSDVQFVAPIQVGDDAYIGAGSTITEDVPAKALAVARSRQINKHSWVSKKMNSKKRKR